jgi:hypothetical protein
MIIHRNRQNLLGLVLSDDEFIKGLLYFMWFGKLIDKRSLAWSLNPSA